MSASSDPQHRLLTQVNSLTWHGLLLYGPSCKGHNAGAGASRLSNFAAAIGARPAPLAGIDIAVMQDTVEQSAGSASTLPAHMSLSKPLSPAPSAQLLLPGNAAQACCHSA